MDQSLVTRLIQAIKGVGRFSDAKARVVTSVSTTRDLLPETLFAAIGSVTAHGSTAGTATALSITDAAGNLYAMVGVVGAAEGATVV